MASCDLRGFCPAASICILSSVLRRPASCQASSMLSSVPYDSNQRSLICSVVCPASCADLDSQVLPQHPALSPASCPLAFSILSSIPHQTSAPSTLSIASGVCAVTVLRPVHGQRPRRYIMPGAQDAALRLAQGGRKIDW